jgi:hypothetical protein
MKLLSLKNDAEIELFIMMFMIHTVKITDRIYQNNDDEDFKIKIKLNSLRVDTNDNRGDYMWFDGNHQKIHACNLKDTFGEHMKPYKDSYDHGVMMTDKQINVAGCTTIKGICGEKKYSVIAVRRFDIYDSLILPHELGHNLGIKKHSKISK